MSTALLQRLYDAGEIDFDQGVSESSRCLLVPCSLGELLSLPQPDPELVESLRQISVEKDGKAISRGEKCALSNPRQLDPWLGTLLRTTARRFTGGRSAQNIHYEAGSLQDFVWATSLAAEIKNGGVEKCLPRELLCLQLPALLPRLAKRSDNDPFGSRPLDQLQVPAKSSLALLLPEGYKRPLSTALFPRVFPKDPVERVFQQLLHLRQMAGELGSLSVEVRFILRGAGVKTPSPYFSFESRKGDTYFNYSHAELQEAFGRLPLFSDYYHEKLAESFLVPMRAIASIPGSTSCQSEIRVSSLNLVPRFPMLKFQLQQTAGYTFNGMVSALAAANESQTSRLAPRTGNHL